MPDHLSDLRNAIFRLGSKLLLVSTCLLLLLLLLVGLSTSQAARSSPAAHYALDWHAIHAGGDSSGGAYRIAGSIGQASDSLLSGGDYQVIGGFWVQPLVIQLYLPIVSR